MMRLSLLFAAVATLLLGLGSGCKVDPQFDGRSVSCEVDADCAHLTDDTRSFVCQENLCVRVDLPHPCGTPCADDEYCDPDLLECIPNSSHPCGGPCPDEEYCDETSGQCRPYDEHPCGGPCPDDKYCDEPSGECIPNSSHPCGGPCPDDKYCDEASGQCKPLHSHPCGGPCEHGLVCDEEANVCVGDPALCSAVCHPLDDCVLDRCEEGEVVVTISTAPETWARHNLHLGGEVLWSGGSNAPVVECVIDDLSVSAVLGIQEDTADGRKLTAWTCDLDLASLPQGPFVVVVGASDTQAGLARLGEAQLQLIRDITSPSVTIEPEVTTIYEPDRVFVTVTMSDAAGEDDGELHAMRFQVLAPGGQKTLDSVATYQRPTGERNFIIPFEADPDIAAPATPVQHGAYTLLAWAVDAACANDPECIDMDCFLDTSCEFPGTAEDLEIGSYTNSVFVHRNVPLELVIWDPAVSTEMPTSQDTVRVSRDGNYNVAVIAAYPEQVVGRPRLVQRRSTYAENGNCTQPLDMQLGLDEIDAGAWQVDMSAMTPCLESEVKAYPIVATARSIWTVPASSTTEDLSAPDPSSVACNDPDDLEDGAACASVVIDRLRWSQDVCGTRTGCAALTPAAAADGTLYVTYNYESPSGNGVADTFDLASLTADEGLKTLVRFQRAGTALDGPVVLDRSSSRRIYVWSQDAIMRMTAFDTVSAGIEWTYPTLGVHHVVGLPAVAGGLLYLPVLSDSGYENTDRIAWMDAMAGTLDALKLGSQSINRTLTMDTSLVLYRNRELQVEQDYVALVSPAGEGASLLCAPDTSSGSGWNCPSWSPIDLTAGRRGTLAVDTGGFYVGSPTDLTLRQWSNGTISKTALVNDIVAGPVAGPNRAAAATSQGVLIWNVLQNSTSLIAHGGSEAVQGMSMGFRHTIYLLHSNGYLQARPPVDSEYPFWSIGLAGPIEATVTPTIASYGTHLTDWTHAAPGTQRPTGVLYVAHGGRISAFIIDEPGGALGWPNLRGGPGRTGTRNYALEGVVEPVDPDPGIEPPPGNEG